MDGQRKQPTIFPVIICVSGPWTLGPVLLDLLPTLHTEHTHMLTPGGERRSGLSRGEKEREPSVMLAREKPLGWFRSWTECERDKAGKLINKLQSFLKKTSPLYSQPEYFHIRWYFPLRILQIHAILHPYQQGNFIRHPLFLYVQHQPSRLNHHYLLPNSCNSFLFHYAATKYDL